MDGLVNDSLCISDMRRGLVVPSLLYFAYFACHASAGRFISLFLLDYGLTDAEVGFILGCGTLTSLVFKPIMGYLADFYGSRIVMLWGSTISCLIFILNAFSTQFQGSSRVYFLLVLWSARSPFNVTPIVDAFTVVHLANSSDDGLGDLSKLPADEAEEVKATRTAAYGKCRLWGAVSWAITNLALGALMDSYGSTHVMLLSSTITTIFFIALVLLVVPSPRPIQAEKHVNNTEAEVEAEEEEGTFTTFLRALIRSPYSLAFFFVTFCQGGGSALVEGMVFLYFREHLQASNFLCGVSVVVTVLFEIPLFAVSTTALKKVGVDALLVISMVCYIVRVFIYTIIPSNNPEWVLFVEPAHGITYSTFTMASVQFIAGKSPLGLENSAQSLLALVRSFGSIAGTAGAGLLMAQYGAVNTYRAFALIVMGALAIWISAVYLSSSFSFSSSSPSTTFASSPSSSSSSSSEQVKGGRDQVYHLVRRSDSVAEKGVQMTDCRL